MGYKSYDIFKTLQNNALRFGSESICQQRYGYINTTLQVENNYYNSNYVWDITRGSVVDTHQSVYATVGQ